jgi:spore maturation protein CgeB
MSDLFAANLDALAARSPQTAQRVVDPSAAGQFRVAAASNGEPIVECSGRPLESRRAPGDAARRQADSVPAGSVTVVGFGCGYLAEALISAGRDVAAVVESDPAALAVAFLARDLTRVLSKVPVLLTSQLIDAAELVLLKARAPVLVPLGARVGTDEHLARIVAAWPALGPVGRRPRVLVAGPVAGGAADAAAAAARAAEAVGADTQFADVAPFAPAASALASLPLPGGHREDLQAGLANLLGQVVTRYAASFQPDLVLAVGRAPITRPLLDGLRGAGARTACWFVENWRAQPAWKDVAGGCDVFFAIQGAPFLDRVRAAGAGRAVYLPPACDPSSYAPRTLTAEEQGRFGGSIGFAGAACLNRVRILASLSDLDLRIWGEGWDKTPLVHLCAGTGLSAEDRARVFAGTAINLNIHAASHVDDLDPDPDYLNPRTFEVAACRAFQLVDARTPLREAFRDDEVVSFGSMSELRDRVRHFLARPDERRACAERARARAMSEHTFAHRLRTILSAVLPAEMVAAALTPRATARVRDEVSRLEQVGGPMGGEEALLRILMHLETRA